MRPIILGVFCIFLGCATEPEKPTTKAHAATSVNDLFAYETGMPIRQLKEKQEFFFKKCSLEERRPFDTKAEYSCSSLPSH